MNSQHTGIITIAVERLAICRVTRLNSKSYLSITSKWNPTGAALCSVSLFKDSVVGVSSVNWVSAWCGSLQPVKLHWFIPAKPFDTVMNIRYIFVHLDLSLPHMMQNSTPPTPTAGECSEISFLSRKGNHVSSGHRYSFSPPVLHREHFMYQGIYDSSSDCYNF